MHQSDKQFSVPFFLQVLSPIIGSSFKDKRILAHTGLNWRRYAVTSKIKIIMSFMAQHESVNGVYF